MTALTLGDQQIEYDRESTVAAYGEIQSGGAERCGCAGCRNFIAQRESAYPKQFVSLLEQLGIDPRKEGEVYESGGDAGSMHMYGGWFYFAGRLVVAGEYLMEAGLFRYFIGTRFPPPPKAFAEHLVLTVEFATELPWVVD
jgi:hypothetical protein